MCSLTFVVPGAHFGLSVEVVAHGASVVSAPMSRLSVWVVEMWVVASPCLVAVFVCCSLGVCHSTSTGVVGVVSSGVVAVPLGNGWSVRRMSGVTVVMSVSSVGVVSIVLSSVWVSTLSVCICFVSWSVSGVAWIWWVEVLVAASLSGSGSVASVMAG